MGIFCCPDHYAVFLQHRVQRTHAGGSVESPLQVGLILTASMFISDTNLKISVIGFVTLIHGLTPRFGVYLMNVRHILCCGVVDVCHSDVFPTELDHVQNHGSTLHGNHRCVYCLISRTVADEDNTGWVVLSGHTKIQDPHQNFRNAFAGSSHSSSDVRSQFFATSLLLTNDALSMLLQCSRLFSPSTVGPTSTS